MTATSREASISVSDVPSADSISGSTGLRDVHDTPKSPRIA